MALPNLPKFDLVYNTSSDYVKAASAGVIGVLAAIQGSLPEGLTAGEAVGAVIAGVVAFGTVLGIYSTTKKSEPETPEAPPEPVTEEPVVVGPEVEEVAPEAEAVEVEETTPEASKE